MVGICPQPKVDQSAKSIAKTAKKEGDARRNAFREYGDPALEQHVRSDENRAHDKAGSLEPGCRLVLFVADSAMGMESDQASAK